MKQSRIKKKNILAKSKQDKYMILTKRTKTITGISAKIEV